MTKLKLSAIPDYKPVKVTVELPAAVFRDLEAYAAILAQANAERVPPEPTRLVALMVARFMETDRGFAKAKQNRSACENPSTP